MYIVHVCEWQCASQPRFVLGHLGEFFFVFFVFSLAALVVVGLGRGEVTMSALNHRHVFGVLPPLLGQSHGDAHAQQKECNPDRRIEDKNDKIN